MNAELLAESKMNPTQNSILYLFKYQLQLESAHKKVLHLQALGFTNTFQIKLDETLMYQSQCKYSDDLTTGRFFVQ